MKPEEKQSLFTKHSKKITFLILLCFIASFGIAAISVNWRTVPELMHRINWFLVPLILLTTFISYWSGGLSYIYACKIFSFKTPASVVLKVGFLSTVADNIAMIGNIGGHSIRMFILAKYNERPSEILASSIFAGYFYNVIFFAFFPLAFILLALDHTASPFSIVTLSTLFGVFIFATILLTCITFLHGTRDMVLRFCGNIFKKLSKKDTNEFLGILSNAMREGVQYSKAHPGDLRLLLLYSLIDWITNALTTELCLLTLGIYVHPGVLLLGFVISIAAGAVSFIPGGLGVQDGSMVGIYSLLGVPFGTGVLAVLLFRIVYYFIPYFFSIFIYRDVTMTAHQETLPLPVQDVSTTLSPEIP